MAALRKKGGGVRGIVAGEVIAKQLGYAVKEATSPFQYALSTQSGRECVVHVQQALTELDPETITSIDGIRAHDTMSRKAMFEGLERVVRGVLPFVRLFYSSPSAYLWENEDGEVHTIHQGEVGEQGDALMPLLFCMGQHAALEAIQRGMSPDEKFLAFLDDLYIVSKPQRVGTLHSAAQQ